MTVQKYDDISIEAYNIYLSKFSTKDLENELRKRKTIPQPKDTIDWKPVLNKAIAIRNDIANDKWDDDYLNQLYDSVISSIFGPTYFTWEEKQDVFKARCFIRRNS